MLTVETIVPLAEVTFRDHLYSFLRRRRHAPPHVHRCPVCYGHEACGMDCAIEPDLELDDGAPCASFEVCSACEREIAARIKRSAEILGRWADDGGPAPEPDLLAYLIERGDG